MTADAALFDPTMDDFGPVEEVEAEFSMIAFPGVYALFDEDGDCLYVGQSGSVPARLRAHRKKPWYPKVTHRRILRLKGEEERLTRETVLCLSQKPCHNRAIKLGKRSNGIWYECQFLRFAGSKKKGLKK